MQGALLPYVLVVVRRAKMWLALMLLGLLQPEMLLQQLALLFFGALLWLWSALMLLGLPQPEVLLLQLALLSLGVLLWWQTG
jgi:hypothetical protein